MLWTRRININILSFKVFGLVKIPSRSSSLLAVFFFFDLMIVFLACLKLYSPKCGKHRMYLKLKVNTEISRLCKKCSVLKFHKLFHSTSRIYTSCWGNQSVFLCSETSWLLNSRLFLQTYCYLSVLLILFILVLGSNIFSGMKYRYLL